MRRRGVCPGVSQRFKPRPFLGDRPQQIEKIACGPRQSIETGDDQNIPLCQARHQARKLLAVGPRTADLLLKYLGAFGGFELSQLGGQGLTIGAYPRLSVNRYIAISHI